MDNLLGDENADIPPVKAIISGQNYDQLNPPLRVGQPVSIHMVGIANRVGPSYTEDQYLKTQGNAVYGRLLRLLYVAQKKLLHG